MKLSRESHPLGLCVFVMWSSYLVGYNTSALHLPCCLLLQIPDSTLDVHWVGGIQVESVSQATLSLPVALSQYLYLKRCLWTSILESCTDIHYVDIHPWIFVLKPCLLRLHWVSGNGRIGWPKAMPCFENFSD